MYFHIVQVWWSREVKFFTQDCTNPNLHIIFRFKVFLKVLFIVNCIVDYSVKCYLEQHLYTQISETNL